MGRTTVRRLAWPGRWQLRCCIRGERLPCGCLVGVYETYDGGSLALIDAVSASCVPRQHDPNAVVWEEPKQA